MICHIEPKNPPDDMSVVEVCVTTEQAIRHARASFAQARPTWTDSRTDAEALDDYMVVQWAVEKPDVTLDRS